MSSQQKIRERGIQMGDKALLLPLYVLHVS